VCTFSDKLEKKDYGPWKEFEKRTIDKRQQTMDDGPLKEK